MFLALSNIYLPKRIVFDIFALVGMISMYTMRSSISVSIVAMVNQTAVSTKNLPWEKKAECPNFNDGNNTMNYDNGYRGEQYDWDIKTQANILGAYFYGNVATQLIGGILAERFGAKHVYGGGILTTAIVFLLSPLAAKLGPAALMVNRVIQGLCDGLTVPAINVAISKWSPTNERSRVSALIFSGMQIGTVIGMPISGLLCTTDFLGGWPSVFYLFGSIACIWFVFWCLLIYENPSMHPSISKEELRYIEENKNDQKRKMTKDLWKNIFTSLPVWALIIIHFGVDYGYLIILMLLPTYLSTALNFDLKSNGLLSTLPFLAIVVGAGISSYVADYLRKNNKMSITAIRKLMTLIGVYIPALILIGVTLAGCNRELIITLLCAAMLFVGFVLSGFNVTHVDMCPDFAGTLFGITNSVANVAGIVGPLSVALFTASGGTLANWGKVFYAAAAVYIVTGSIFAAFASAELQPWGTHKHELKQSPCSEDVSQSQIKIQS